LHKKWKVGQNQEKIVLKNHAHNIAHVVELSKKFANAKGYGERVSLLRNEINAGSGHGVG
tara:strand:- start:493 stop:672 length:180 start_codon:yes stop_codon:yes gene_type:complete